jgi:tetratricopeptide (TPR) repeat protein
LDRILVRVVIVMVMAVLCLTGWILYVVLVPVSAPRTATERQVMKFEELSTTQPKNPNVWADWARTLVAAGEFAKAAEVIERGSREASESAPIRVIEAQMLAAQGRDAESLALITRVVAELKKLEADEIRRMAAAGTRMTESGLYSPYIVDALVLQGEVRRKEGDLPGALAAYTDALGRRPDMADILVARGDLYSLTGKRDQAVEDYRKALTMIPEYEPALDGLSKLGEAAEQ